MAAGLFALLTCFVPNLEMPPAKLPGIPALTAWLWGVQEEELLPLSLRPNSHWNGLLLGKVRNDRY